MRFQASLSRGNLRESAQRTTMKPSDDLHDIPAPALEFAFDMHLTFAGRPILGTYPKGRRNWAQIDGGTFTGPDISGIVLGGGSDWPLSLTADMEYMEFDARYMLRTHDDVHIYVQNRGALWGTPEVRRRLRDDEPVDPAEYYHRSTPVFDAPKDGAYAWLARTMFVASGSRRHDNSAQIRVFKIL
jgi:hypothetical protein